MDLTPSDSIEDLGRQPKDYQLHVGATIYLARRWTDGWHIELELGEFEEGTVVTTHVPQDEEQVHLFVGGSLLGKLAGDTVVLVVAR